MGVSFRYEKRSQKENIRFFGSIFIWNLSYSAQGIISDLDEIFSVCRAFNSEHFDKKHFPKGFCFDENMIERL